VLFWMGDSSVTPRSRGMRLHAVHARTVSDCQGMMWKFSGGFLSVTIATHWIP
jgi:hypothetical protein